MFEVSKGCTQKIKQKDTHICMKLYVSLCVMCRCMEYLRSARVVKIILVENKMVEQICIKVILGKEKK